MPGADPEAAPGAPTGERGRFAQAVAAIDAVNAEDPVRLVIDGQERAKELVHADVVERWVRHLDPEADDAQLLAARAHHLRRWAVGRHEYPEGRAGYLRWRADAKRRQADEVAELLRGVGYGEGTVERVADLVAKRGLGRDPQVQTHEDALCLAFLELQFDEVAERLGFDHTVSVVAKTAAKMSPAGLAATSEIAFSEAGRAILAAALAPPPAP